MSLKNSVNRNRLRREYDTFSRQWRERRAEARQKLLSPSNDDDLTEEERNLINGRKPTFNEFVHADRQLRHLMQESRRKRLEEQAAQDAQIDTSWEEEPAGQETSKIGEQT